MKSFWIYLTQSGTDPTQEEAGRNRVLVINHFNIITIILMLAGVINLLLLKDYDSVWVLSGGALALIAGLFVNHAGFSDTSASILVTVVSLVIFFYSSYFGTGPGIYFFYFPLSMCIAFLFEFQQRRTLFLVHFGFLVLLVFILLVTHLSLFKIREFSAEYIRQVFGFDLIVSVMLLLYFIYLVTKNNEFRHRKLLANIEERKQAEESTRISLREKETLLAEVHHRVKNNLAVISSLLNLQMHSANNDYTRDILLDCKTRVASMALVHEKLYRSESLAEIGLHTYLPDLIGEIRNAFGDHEERIVVELSVPEVFLTVSEAIPCGLILNELITNAFKHAFTSQPAPRITVEVKPLDRSLQITVADNGSGMPEIATAGEAETLGLILIQSLADQLDGKYEFRNRGGTWFSLIFTPKNLSGVSSNKSL